MNRLGRYSYLDYIFNFIALTIKLNLDWKPWCWAVPYYHTLLLKVLLFLSCFSLRPLTDDNILFLVYSLDSSHHPNFLPITCQGGSFGGVYFIVSGFWVLFKSQMKNLQYNSSTQIILKLKIPSKPANMLFAVLKAFLYFSLLLTSSLKSHFSVVHFLFCICWNSSTGGLQWGSEQQFTQTFLNEKDVVIGVDAGIEHCSQGWAPWSVCVLMRQHMPFA